VPDALRLSMLAVARRAPRSAPPPLARVWARLIARLSRLRLQDGRTWADAVWGGPWPEPGSPAVSAMSPGPMDHPRFWAGFIVAGARTALPGAPLAAAASGGCATSGQRSAGEGRMGRAQTPGCGDVAGPGAAREAASGAVQEAASGAGRERAKQRGAGPESRSAKGALETGAAKGPRGPPQAGTEGAVWRGRAALWAGALAALAVAGVLASVRSRATASR
jgi:hypothetical protein